MMEDDCMTEEMISIIIPCYEASTQSLRRCLRRLRGIYSGPLEIIFINDGSDEGVFSAIADYHPGRFTEVRYLYQEHAGVSAARNNGIRHARGRYIFFLDMDDALEPGTVEKVARFFDRVYDEVDLVTYPIETIYNGRVLPPHFRYQFLAESGVYDLWTQPYVGQTTMNIAVKNRFADNVLFHEDLSFSEDQKYCCDVLKRTLKMGYCSQGKYLYHRSPVSTSGLLAGACFIFEQSMSLFEDIFSGFEGNLPLAWQGLYVNDVYWKLMGSLLFPHHYDAQEYAMAVERIRLLLDRCENRVILEHPHMDFFVKFFLLRLKHRPGIQCRVEWDHFGLLMDGRVILQERSMEIVVTRLSYLDGRIGVEGFIKSAVLQFCERKPVVRARKNKNSLRKLELFESAHNYYLSHEKTQRFMAFRYEDEADEIQSLSFEVELGGFYYHTHFYFMPCVSLSQKYGIYSCRKGDMVISVEENQSLRFEKRACAREPVWLYYDCAGAGRHNGYIQFEHDIGIRDGISRYYIVSDARQADGRAGERSRYVKFGSTKHKRLLRQCSKILTAYIEEENLFPYSARVLEREARYFDFEVIYLQHGVLHIVMPYKYSREKILADKIVVSTREEAALYLANGYCTDDLIKAGMPKLHILSEKKKGCQPRGLPRRILFAPSWRSYLVGAYEKHQWPLLEKKFLASSYYGEIDRYLHSGKLSAFLEKNKCEMDVKLHPIFQGYQKHFSWTSDRISWAEEDVQENLYDLFVTDFSSYAYEFYYLGIPVVNFIPDKMEFLCGMNGYREINEPDFTWKEAPSRAEDVVDEMEKALLGSREKVFVPAFYRCEDICGEIYKNVSGR